MSIAYYFAKHLIPHPIRSFIRDLDNAYHNLERKIDSQEKQIQHLDNSYKEMHTSYQDLNASHQQLQVSYQELQDLYRILGKSHRKIVGCNNRKVTVITEKPVAYDSPDHIEPWGTKQDNSIHLKFNYKLAQWIPLEQLTVLDLGCAGGGFVKSIIDIGCFAVGIEGSDYSLIRGRAEWSTIPGNLFTADVTEPFQILVQSENEENCQPFQFKVITAWEFIEHISADKLKMVFQNISTHLEKDGVVIMSVSPNEEVINGVKLHQTVENKEWWLAECHRNGFVHHEQVLRYFDQDYVRSEPNAANSFHLILTRIGESLPVLRFDI
jgi:2-polyprenyl-3-methyl-5-hydroxy-6-metoxy-1,4-benzoquinol methylase